VHASGGDKERSSGTTNDSLLAIIGKDDHGDTASLSEGDQQQLAAWNATQQKYPCDRCAQQLVQEQAAIRPDAVALVVGNQTLSYQDVNQRANQLAHSLRAFGVGPNVLVGLCIERSPEMVIGLLGILKAGGAYVPLDPTYPSERLAFMVEDAHAPILVTQQHLMAKLPTCTTPIICLDADAPLLAQQSQSDPPAIATGDDLAYVIYTSGSTGRPKGVEITHKGLLNLIFWHQQAFAVTAADRATQIASPAFDATGWELWPYLSIGASVYLIDEQIRTLPIALRDWLVSSGITISFLPTSLAESMLSLEWPPETALRYLLTGADTLHQYPGAALPFAFVNNYGPTEATVVATSGRITPVEQADTLPPIGRPIANTQVYILDAYLRQTPIGMPGELCISGVGLARGYLNRPELTAEKFIPHPLSDEPGARLYRTGDLVRYQPDGQIAFLGRIDHQIKLRGYRIEPDEIVSVLNRHPAVQTSYVMTREDALGEKRLVAYIVVHPGMQISLGSLQDMVKASLPDYMVPASFVLLKALPLTPNGKVDRTALPAPNRANMLPDEAFTAPGTLLEEKIAEIVSALLHVEQVGIDSNFFMLGGHSMLGAQLVAHITHTFGIELPLRTMFAAPTVRQLAAEVERRIMDELERMPEIEARRLLE
jgi:amino acid adenylation domain-containing protein